MASALFEQRNHGWSVDVPTSGSDVGGDPVRLAQVLTNLLTNAARYTAVGGLIRLSARCEDGVIAIRVVDNGIGIAPELLPRIFDPFVQGSRSSDRAEGGLGLGLAVAKNLVMLHGGTLERAQRRAGQGQRVRDSPSGAVAGGRGGRHRRDGVETRVAAPAATRKRILLVDDNVDAAELLGERSRSAGHDVTVANDARAALEAFPKLEPAGRGARHRAAGDGRLRARGALAHACRPARPAG